MAGTSQAPTSTWREVVAVALPALLLLGVAAVGTWRFANVEHVAWRTLAFGMFSRVEDHPNRLVVARAPDTPQGTVLVPPPELRSLVDSVKVAPTAARLDRLAAAWSATEGVPASLEIDVLGPHFDADTHTLTFRLVTRHRYEADP